jgi:RNA polymerase sigma factor (sigma-70 family)
VARELDDHDDAALLAVSTRDPDAFAVFYRRHARAVAAYFHRRTGDAETAADLTAETFAAALHGVRRFDPGHGPAVGWLFGIAGRKLIDLQRRGAVEQRARRRMGMERLVLDDEGIAAIEAAATAQGGEVELLLDALPKDQRAAVQARVLDEQDYAAIAAEQQTTESAVRQRVSRGLASLREATRRQAS